MKQGNNNTWLHNLTSNLKSTFSNPLPKLTHLLALPKRFYDQHPRTTISLTLSSLLLAGGSAFIVANQQSALYFPEMGFGRSNQNNPRSLRHPKARGLQADNLQIATEDNVIIRGWHIKKQDSERIVVYFHGNAGNTGTRLPFVESLLDKTNSDVIIVGYRGYSDSDGKPTQRGLEKDAQAILNEAINIAQRDKKKLYVFGTSLGGAVSIYVSGLARIRENIQGVIVQNTFTSTTDVVASLSPVLKVFVPFLRLMNRNSWNSLSRINQLRSPILFIKCGMDEVVPPSMTDKLREECNRHHIHNYLYDLPNGRHNEVHIADPVNYFNQLNEFFGAT